MSLDHFVDVSLLDAAPALVRIVVYVPTRDVVKEIAQVLLGSKA